MMRGMVRALHAWSLEPEQAIQVQAQLRAQLVLRWDGRAVRTIAGVDVSLSEARAHAAIVVLRYPQMTPIEGVTADAPLVFPYIPVCWPFEKGRLSSLPGRSSDTHPTSSCLTGRASRIREGSASPRRWVCGWNAPRSALPSPGYTVILRNPGRTSATRARWLTHRRRR